MAHPEQVCLIRLSAIGDCCHTVPVLRRLQAAWPQTRFCWIIGAAEATLLGDIDGVEFIVFNKSKGLAAYSDVRRALRNKRFDLLLHMHASMRANLVSRLVSAPVRLGFDRARARDYQWLFSNQKIAAETGQHAMDALLGFARHLGVTEQTLRWDIPIAADDYAVADQHCQPQKKMMLISPCSSQRFRNHRNWDAIRYAEVASYAIEQHQMQVILTGGNTTLEAEYAQQIVELTGHPITNLVGQTNLKQLLALIDRAFVVLCPDSGPAHMATAVATPVIGLYATSNPARTGPYLSQEWVVNRYPEAVRKAFGKNVEDLRWGERVRDPQAMQLIQVADVTEKLDQLVQVTP